MAARGLDVDDVKVVINYDYPKSGSEDYVHRIGRTGRRNKTGTSYTFLTEQNASQASDLMNILRQAKQTVPDELVQLAGMARNRGGFGGTKRRYGGGGGGGGFRGGMNGHSDFKRRKFD